MDHCIVAYCIGLKALWPGDTPPCPEGAPCVSGGHSPCLAGGTPRVPGSAPCVPGGARVCGWGGPRIISKLVLGKFATPGGYQGWQKINDLRHYAGQNLFKTYAGQNLFKTTPNSSCCTNTLHFGEVETYQFKHISEYIGIDRNMVLRVVLSHLFCLKSSKPRHA